MKLLLIVVVCFFSWSTCMYTALASTFLLVPQQTALHVGDAFYIDVIITTEDETINAVGAAVTYPDFVRFLKYEDKDSIVSLWVAAPHEEGGSISFEGVIPGGIDTAQGQLTRLYFEVVSSGQGPFGFLRAEALLHDGQGTPSAVSKENIHVSVVPGEATRPLRPSVDDEAPEPFSLQVVTDADVHGGRPSLVFAAQDKFTGIAYYEVKEGIFDLFKKVTSPYALTHEPGSVTVTVRAVDGAGNSRESTLYPHTYFGFAAHIPLLFSILGVFVLLCSVFFLLYSKRVSHFYFLR